ncbi:MAG: AI-2E family transporter [Candidatus Liberibacter europaeus]|uniref:AI-2E family transporter n=1 Tax=Candidatus Liberibacter europaeus TaxID=744859 RepID=A0A2T4VWA2_9HYPH|nr:AI-2E family transporter [Candidatus Liberibacter europaeus]PTL86030.1 MAG: AI-2E family transporter [Candidatus Liberibacter europaeus]
MRESVLRPQGATRWAIIFISLLSLYFLRGFFVSITIAIVIGCATWPLYSMFRCNQTKSSTFLAICAVLIIICLIILPISFFSYYAFVEIQDIASQAILLNEKGIPVPHWLYSMPASSWLTKLWNTHIAKPQGLKILAENFLKTNGIEFIKEIVSCISICAIDYSLSTIFMLIALFFIYRDGNNFYQQIDILGEYVFPTYWNKLSKIIPKVIRSTVLGITVIAIGEGLILGSAYWMAGVQSHVALGVITAIMSMIPGGAPAACTIVSIYLAMKNNIFNAICLFSWGTIELFIVDKTIRPFLVGGPIKLPFLPTFFGLVGGVRTMGLLGLFIGPVLMALITTIWKESVKAAKEINQKQNN